MKEAERQIPNKRILQQTRYKTDSINCSFETFSSIPSYGVNVFVFVWVVSHAEVFASK